jgi:ParB family chromosome partitioning protein
VFGYSRESCVQTGINGVAFSNAPAGFRDSIPGRAIAERSDDWRGRMPQSDRDVWDWIQMLDEARRASLFAQFDSLGCGPARKWDPVKFRPSRWK